MLNAVQKSTPWLLLLLVLGCSHASDESNPGARLQPTRDNGQWFVLKKSDLAAGTHHTRHAEIFGKYVTGYNYTILQAIDKVQATAPDGGGYFTGIKAVPTESPVGYTLKLFDKPLLDPPRTTSYCSGATYAAFIENLNMLFRNRQHSLSPDRYEALRMQEKDGGRREDTVKFWGKWNDDGYGNHYALVQYARMGDVLKPHQARPGDFVNISWKHGGGHSTIFLGWYKDEAGKKYIVYWSSQTRTNGFGDEVIPIERIKEIKVVRLTHPERLFSFDPATPVNRNIPGDVIDW